jgi:hypothetical protein
MLEQIKAWESLIEANYGCASLHLGSEDVEEKVEGLPAWKGTVQVFGLISCGRAKRAYLFEFGQGSQTETMSVLGIPPVDSARSAVRQALVAAQRAGAQAKSR